MFAANLDRLESGIDRLAFERQHSEDAFVNAAEWFVIDEALQCFDSQREFTSGERSLARESAGTEAW